MNFLQKSLSFLISMLLFSEMMVFLCPSILSGLGFTVALSMNFMAMMILTITCTAIILAALVSPTVRSFMASDDEIFKPYRIVMVSAWCLSTLSMLPIISAILPTWALALTPWLFLILSSLICYMSTVHICQYIKKNNGENPSTRAAMPPESEGTSSNEIGLPCPRADEKKTTASPKDPSDRAALSPESKGKSSDKQDPSTRAALPPESKETSSNEENPSTRAALLPKEETITKPHDTKTNPTGLEPQQLPMRPKKTPHKYEENKHKSLWKQDCSVFDKRLTPLHNQYKSVAVWSCQGLQNILDENKKESGPDEKSSGDGVPIQDQPLITISTNSCNGYYAFAFEAYNLLRHSFLKSTGYSETQVPINLKISNWSMLQTQVSSHISPNQRHTPFKILFSSMPYLKNEKRTSTHYDKADLNIKFGYASQLLFALLIQLLWIPDEKTTSTLESPIMRALAPLLRKAYKHNPFKLFFGPIQAALTQKDQFEYSPFTPNDFEIFRTPTFLKYILKTDCVILPKNHSILKEKGFFQNKYFHHFENMRASLQSLLQEKHGSIKKQTTDWLKGAQHVKNVKQALWSNWLCHHQDTSEKKTSNADEKHSKDTVSTKKAIQDMLLIDDNLDPVTRCFPQPAEDKQSVTNIFYGITHSRAATLYAPKHINAQFDMNSYQAPGLTLYRDYTGWVRSTGQIGIALNRLMQIEINQSLLHQAFMAQKSALLDILPKIKSYIKESKSTAPIPIQLCPPPIFIPPNKERAQHIGEKTHCWTSFSVLKKTMSCNVQYLIISTCAFLKLKGISFDRFKITIKLPTKLYVQDCSPANTREITQRIITSLSQSTASGYCSRYHCNEKLDKKYGKDQPSESKSYTPVRYDRDKLVRCTQSGQDRIGAYVVGFTDKAM